MEVVVTIRAGHREVVSVSISIEEDDKRIIGILKRRLEETEEDKNTLKPKFMKLEGDVVETMNPMALHVQRFEENSKKLAAENEMFHLEKKGRMSLQISPIRQKRSAK